MGPLEIAVSAFITPFVVSFLKDPNASDKVKYAVSMGVALVVALGNAFLNGNLVPGEVAQNFATVLASANAVYHMFLRNGGINARVEALGVGRAKASMPAPDLTVTDLESGEVNHDDLSGY